ncbi:MAG: hypothetical protein ACRBM6_38210 [Geminicoccales bacterium]
MRVYDTAFWHIAMPVREPSTASQADMLMLALSVAAPQACLVMKDTSGTTVRENEGGKALPKDKRLWYIIGAVIVILVIGYAAGWFGGGAEPEPASEEQGAEEKEAPAQ